MSIRKPWTAASADAIQAVPAVVGVYEIADLEGELLYIGQAGGREPFGLRSRLAAHFGGAEANPVLRERAHSFRWEANQQYTTKRLELLMQYQRDQAAAWPPANAAGGWQDQPQLGRLRRSDGPLREEGKG